MSGPHSETGDAGDTGDTRQVSVAELLARNGTVGAPAGSKRRRRRRGDTDAVTVAELTGEIPIIRDDHEERPAPPQEAPAPPRPAPPAEREQPGNGLPQALSQGLPQGLVQAAPPEAPPAPPTPPAPPAPSETVPPAAAETAPPKSTYWSEPEPRWPKSDPRARRPLGPERSEYPRPLRHTEAADAEGVQSGAEHMNPDPVGHYTDTSVDVMDSEVPEAPGDDVAGTALDDAGYGRSYLSDDASEHTLFGGQSIADEVARRRSQEQAPPLFDQGDAEVARQSGGKAVAIWRAVVTVLQSMLAVVFGAGLFIAFDQLWRWNSIVALVLSVLVILGLVVGVRVVRKTEDIASTLIAVAVGALITLGPLALLQSS